MQGKQLRTHLKKASKKTGNCLKKAAWQTCKCALWITCAPCLCCALLCLPRRQRRGCVINGELPEYARPQFPTPRPRALSLPLVAPQLEQWTLDQTQSEFMTKLPLEIRRMIYERTLGGASIHLATYDGKSNAMECWRDECRCDYFDPLQEKRLTFGMGLLRTCRVMCVHRVAETPQIHLTIVCSMLTPTQLLRSNRISLLGKSVLSINRQRRSIHA
jgi:hypothetical protein